MMAELGENAPVYSLLPQIKNYQTPNHYDNPFYFRKGKTENLSYQFRATSSFLINLLNTRDIKTPIYFYC